MQHVMMSFYQHTENGSAFRDLEKNKVECLPDGRRFYTARCRIWTK